MLRASPPHYAVALHDRHFVAIVVLPGLGAAVLMSHVIGSPFVLRVGYRLSAKQFALLFAMNVVAFVVAPRSTPGSEAGRAYPHPALRLTMLLVATLVLLNVGVTGAEGLFGLLAVLGVSLGLIHGYAVAVEDGPTIVVLDSMVHVANVRGPARLIWPRFGPRYPKSETRFAWTKQQ